MLTDSQELSWGSQPLQAPWTPTHHGPGASLFKQPDVLGEGLRDDHGAGFSVVLMHLNFDNCLRLDAGDHGC